MEFSEADFQFMERALQLAKLGGVSVAPNPKVGAVITLDNKIIGEGFHQRVGAAHAEVNAIQSVEEKSFLNQATMYVTLEPCSHYGKTPPCSDLIVKYNFKRVVIASTDPNLKVAGRGIEKIKNAGIEVQVGLLEKEARWLNRRFFTSHEMNRPYVILKWAETRDGFIDRLPENRANGINWITQNRMKLFVHQWRSEEQAILVGWRTVLNDNPQLNVREIAGSSPHRFIVDSEGKSPLNRKVFQDGFPTTIITRKNDIDHLPSSVSIVSLPEISAQTIVDILAKKDIISVFIEGGAETHQRFIDAGLWDEAYQLIGKSTFQTGIKAPVLSNKILIENREVDGDLIFHYRKL